MPSALAAPRSKLSRVNDFLKKHKVISRGLSFGAKFHEPLGKYAEIAGLMGYGRRRGGARPLPFTLGFRMGGARPVGFRSGFRSAVPLLNTEQVAYPRF